MPLSSGMPDGMNPLFAMKRASIRGAAASEWQNNRLKLIAASITMLVLLPAIYLLFRFLFGYIYSLESTFTGFGIALARRLMSMTFMTLGVFIGISSFISGFSLLFRSWETSFLLTMPLRDRFTALYRTLESWFNAGWAIFLLGIPIVLAFCRALHLSLLSTAVSIVLFPLLMLVWLSTGTLLLGSSIKLSRRSGRVWRAAALLGLVGAAGIFFVLRSSGPSGIIAGDDTALDALQSFVADLPVAGGMLWPHTLFSSALIAADAGLWGQVLLSSGLLLLEGILGAGTACLLICHNFRNIYCGVSSRMNRRRSSRFLLRGGGGFRTILSKDLLLFLRDPVQWSQLLLLSGLFLVYAMNIRRFPTDITHEFWRSILVYLNFSFSCFVTATLLVRFSFPSISLEGPGLSYLLQLPGGRKLLLRSKLLESLLIIMPFIVGVGIWSTISIGAGGMLVAASTLALFLMCYALVCINVGLGAIFPRFDRASAANIASSHGGIIASFTSMGYVLVTVFALGATLRSSMVETAHMRLLSANMGRALLFLTVFTAAVAFAFTRGGYGSLMKRDF